MSSSTGALCLRLLTPDEIVSDGLLQLQVSTQPYVMNSSLLCAGRRQLSKTPVLQNPCKSAGTALVEAHGVGQQ